MRARASSQAATILVSEQNTEITYSNNDFHYIVPYWNQQNEPSREDDLSSDIYFLFGLCDLKNSILETVSVNGKAVTLIPGDFFSTLEENIFQIRLNKITDLETLINQYLPQIKNSTLNLIINLTCFTRKNIIAF